MLRIGNAAARDKCTTQPFQQYEEGNQQEGHDHAGDKKSGADGGEQLLFRIRVAVYDKAEIEIANSREIARLPLLRHFLRIGLKPRQGTDKRAHLSAVVSQCEELLGL